LIAFRDDIALPAAVFGPRERAPLAREELILRKELIDFSPLDTGYTSGMPGWLETILFSIT
jgi:hypothetical protein